MRNYWIVKGIKFILFAAIAILALGYLVMFLWNWLMPELFFVPTLTFAEALGLFVLAKILFGFGRWGSHYGWHQKHHYWKQHMEQRLKDMTPEEREKFREEWKQRCGKWGPGYSGSATAKTGAGDSQSS